MTNATATTRLDCPEVPSDAQWNEKIRRELLCGRDGELAKHIVATMFVLF